VCGKGSDLIRSTKSKVTGLALWNYSVLAAQLEASKGLYCVSLLCPQGNVPAATHNSGCGPNLSALIVRTQVTILIPQISCQVENRACRGARWGTLRCQDGVRRRTFVDPCPYTLVSGDRGPNPFNSYLYQASRKQRVMSRTWAMGKGVCGSCSTRPQSRNEG
jgi:hypothetical protein